jgi:hypothetical protein
MYRRQCASDTQAELTAEINIHFSGLSNIDTPAFWSSRSFWSVWSAAIRGLPPRKPNWRCLQCVLREECIL